MLVVISEIVMYIILGISYIFISLIIQIHDFIEEQEKCVIVVDNGVGGDAATVKIS